ncbi:hypothetical protein AYO45_01660 [Gammaproteobacteria bacterium SCGC AG-212-F23]|nr:hypothetical protein AYO45_01660 [Gammaproteobacteria bacterium SCGC AG-212-F23]
MSDTRSIKASLLTNEHASAATQFTIPIDSIISPVNNDSGSSNSIQSGNNDSSPRDLGRSPRRRPTLTVQTSPRLGPSSNNSDFEKTFQDNRPQGNKSDSDSDHKRKPKDYKPDSIIPDTPATAVTPPVAKASVTHNTMPLHDRTSPKGHRKSQSLVSVSEYGKSVSAPATEPTTAEPTTTEPTTAEISKTENSEKPETADETSFVPRSAVTNNPIKKVEKTETTDKTAFVPRSAVTGSPIKVEASNCFFCLFWCCFSCYRRCCVCRKTSYANQHEISFRIGLNASLDK